MSSWGNRIGLAVEAPAFLLPTLAVHTDYDFAIAHRVLEDADYAAYFRYREKGRECILDNSFHELRKPISVTDLLAAAEVINPTYIVSPDVMGDLNTTIANYEELQRYKHGYRVAAALVGETPEEREACIDAVKGADMICLPFDAPRYLWFLEQFPHRWYWKRVHLFGVSERIELPVWRVFASTLTLSIDTGKPVKFGLLGSQLAERRTWRKASLSSTRLLELTEATPEQIDLAVVNTLYLRTLLA